MTLPLHRPAPPAHCAGPAHPPPAKPVAAVLPATEAPVRPLAAARVLALAALAWGLGGAPLRAQQVPAAPTDSAVPTALAGELQGLVGQAASTLWAGPTPPLRVVVEVGQLDPRLKLAPCQRIEPYLPAGTRPLGQTRVGLRCRQGATHWNVYLPVTVKLFGRAMVAQVPLAAGTVLQPQHLAEAEVDLAARQEPAVLRREQAVGRTLARAVAAGDALHTGDLALRRWFNAGDTVRIVAQGSGYAVSGEGQALAAGLDGQVIRVRTEGGRIVSGTATSARLVELLL